MSLPQKTSAGRARVDAFLSSLPPADLVYLRSQVNKQPIAGMRCLPDLPPELLCILASHLQLTDISRCLGVSRAWRDAWTHGAVVERMCRDFFPGLLEIQPSTHDVQAVFTQAMAKYLRRAFAVPVEATIPWGMATNTGIFTVEAETEGSRHHDDDPELVRIQTGTGVLYVNGKIMWQPDLFQVIVDDLRTRRRRRCTFTDHTSRGQLLFLAAASDKLLVFQYNRGVDPKIA